MKAITLITFFLVFIASIGNAQEKKFVYSNTIQTEDLHNNQCGSGYSDPNYKCFDGWRFKIYVITVTCPKGWHFTDVWNYNAVEDNQGSLGWNLNYYPKNTKILQYDPQRLLKVEACFGSRAIRFNLKCEIEKD